MTVETEIFRGADGNMLVADIFSKAHGTPVLLLHGGGQTRHAWEKTALRLTQRGMTPISLDQRGHGDSEWVDTGYEFADYGRDLVVVAGDLKRRYGAPPIVIGASLGGLASLMAEGDLAPGTLSALILVDITPRVDRSGVERIVGFMGANLKEGFADLDEAAAAIEQYLPHRARKRRPEGLMKNLRKHADGRYRWHWDPRFLDGRTRDTGRAADIEAGLVAAAQRLTVPVLLVRGGRSELVSMDHVAEFQRLVPHASFVDVSDAGHMVAGDRNDIFADAILGFLDSDAAARLA